MTLFVGLILVLFIVAIIAILKFLSDSTKSEPLDLFSVYNYTVTDNVTGKTTHHSILIRESERKKIIESKLKSNTGS